MVLRMLGMEAKADWFQEAYCRIREELPSLKEWFFARQHLIYAQQFYPALLAVGKYLLTHPGEKYLREYEIPGIDTKFLEHHGRLFRELYNALYPERGVENAAQFEHLCKLGCNSAQGWLISRAAPAQECIRWLEMHAQGRALPFLTQE